MEAGLGGLSGNLGHFSHLEHFAVGRVWGRVGLGWHVMKHAPQPGPAGHTYMKLTIIW